MLPKLRVHKSRASVADARAGPRSDHTRRTRPAAHSPAEILPSARFAPWDTTATGDRYERHEGRPAAASGRRNRAPALGEHNETLLRDLVGLSAEEYQAPIEDGVACDRPP